MNIRAVCVVFATAIACFFAQVGVAGDVAIQDLNSKRVTPKRATAASGDATDRAFAALLSMPGAEPQEGYWDFPVPPDFTVGDERALIAYIAKQQLAGADVNAYRHFGTLLHHAIRAGKVKTAIWLLENGADPKKTILRSESDALALSQEYKRTALATLLQTKYGLVPRPPKQPGTVGGALAPENPTKPLGSSTEVVSARRALIAASLWVNTAQTSQAQQLRAQDEQKAWNLLKAKMQSAAYAELIDDDEAVRSLVRLHAYQPKELNKELSALPVEVRKRRTVAILSAMAEQSRLDGPDKHSTMRYAMPVESWRTVWRLLEHPMDYAGFVGLAEKIQPELWPELFSSGYADRNPETALGCMLAQASARTLKEYWPRLVEQFPQIREAAPRMVLSHYRMESSLGRCWAWEETETTKKLLFLAANGVRATVLGIDTREVSHESVDLLNAMRPFLATTAPSKPARIVDRKPGCTFELTDVWYRELLNKAFIASVDSSRGRVEVDTVQLLEIPGESHCALLVGGNALAGYPSGDFDSFTGPYREPFPSCPDPADTYEVWREHNGTIERLATDMGEDDGAPALISVVDTKTGRTYYLHTGEQYGKCHSGARLPFLFEWRVAKGQMALLRVNSTEMENALYEQCEANGVVHCRGIRVMQGDRDIRAADGPQTSAAAYSAAMDVATFLNVFRPRDRKRYLAAVEQLDKEELRVMQSRGIPAHWTAEAIRHVGTLTLPLADKRKRAAWLFYDHQQLARALDSEVMLKLLEWLPREDWQPLWKVVSASLSRFSGLENLRESAANKGLNALACDIDHARGLMCAEKWGTDRP